MKARMTVTVDSDILAESKTILRDTGMTLSGFINIVLHGLSASHTKSMREMYEDMAITMMRDVTAIDKPLKGKKTSP